MKEFVFSTDGGDGFRERERDLFFLVIKFGKAKIDVTVATVFHLKKIGLVFFVVWTFDF